MRSLLVDSQTLQLFAKLEGAEEDPIDLAVIARVTPEEVRRLSERLLPDDVPQINDLLLASYVSSSPEVTGELMQLYNDYDIRDSSRQSSLRLTFVVGLVALLVAAWTTLSILGALPTIGPILGVESILLTTGWVSAAIVFILRLYTPYASRAGARIFQKRSLNEQVLRALRSYDEKNLASLDPTDLVRVVRSVRKAELRPTSDPGMVAHKG